MGGLAHLAKLGRCKSLLLGLELALSQFDLLRRREGINALLLDLEVLLVGPIASVADISEAVFMSLSRLASQRGKQACWKLTCTSKRCRRRRAQSWDSSTGGKPRQCRKSRQCLHNRIFSQPRRTTACMQRR